MVGIRALHHVIKYPGTARELHRVRGRGHSPFAENIEGNWLLRLARLWTMRHEEQAGDVILTEPMIQEWAAAFAHVRVDRFKLLLMAKRLGLPYRVLAVLHSIDQAILTPAPFARRWCGSAS